MAAKCIFIGMGLINILVYNVKPDGPFSVLVLNFACFEKWPPDGDSPIYEVKAHSLELDHFKNKYC